MAVQELLKLTVELLVSSFVVLMVLDFVSGLVVLWQQIGLKYKESLPVAYDIPDTIYNFGKILALTDISMGLGWVLGDRLVTLFYNSTLIDKSGINYGRSLIG